MLENLLARRPCESWCAARKAVPPTMGKALGPVSYAARKPVPKELSLRHRKTQRSICFQLFLRIRASLTFVAGLSTVRLQTHKLVSVCGTVTRIADHFSR